MYQSDQEVPQKKKAPKQPKKEPKAKKVIPVESYNPNIVKANNKLVGNVERNDLYASDDGRTRQELDPPTNQQLDLDLAP